MFKKILIANRGEIACRIIKTAHKLGIATVAVYSEADSSARHVALADEAIPIGGSEARDSYLVIDNIIAACLQSGAEAIHPGYGFLSENADFAEACNNNIISFIGPSAEAIRAMGSKSSAKALMQIAGVPLIPGYHGNEQDEEKLFAEAEKISYPLLIKAVNGGGGKGMRVVHSAEEFAPALAACQREAESSFGSKRVLLEKYIEKARHVEIQVFGDSYGNYVYLYGRDCSLQRRHQKVIEEAPPPNIAEDLIEAMGQAAIMAAKTVNYQGAGTVEFVVDQHGRYYFMEMNTRLQVEHPVTEMITGLDLVEWQLKIAAGENMPLQQDQIKIHGHALEARIYAEDADNGFLPSIGKLIHLSLPAESRYLRIDSGVEENDQITPYYDPMIAKLIVWDENRQLAIARMQHALENIHIVGVINNSHFLARLLQLPDFVAEQPYTTLIEQQHDFLFASTNEQNIDSDVWLICALGEILFEVKEASWQRRSADRLAPWLIHDGWRINGNGCRTISLEYQEEKVNITAYYLDNAYRFELNGQSHLIVGRLDGNQVLANISGRRLQAKIIVHHDQRYIYINNKCFIIKHIDLLRQFAENVVSKGDLRASMPGKIIAQMVEIGSLVEKDAPLLIVEAMKMEHTMLAPVSGKLIAYNFNVGDQVAEGDELAIIANE